MKSPRHSPSAAARTLSRSLLLAAVGGFGLIAPQANSAGPAAAPSIHSGTPRVGDATVRSETRLRKLHLVRPDLIPYPIAYEVYC